MLVNLSYEDLMPNELPLLYVLNIMFLLRFIALTPNSLIPIFPALRVGHKCG